MFCELNEKIKALSESHEIASHNYFHSTHKNDDLLASKKVLEKITHKEVRGFRMPRMAPVSDLDLLEAGYTYNASDGVFSDSIANELSSVTGSTAAGFVLNHTIMVAGGVVTCAANGGTLSF